MEGILKTLEQGLNQKGWNCVYIPGNEDSPIAQIKVPFRFSELGWNFDAELFVINDLEPSSKPTKAGNAYADPQFIQIMATLPFFASEKTGADMSRFITMINNVTPLMGFCFTEATAQPYFRYVLPVLHGQADAEFVDVCLDAIQYSIDTFGSALQDLAGGQRSLQQIVADDIYWK